MNRLPQQHSLAPKLRLPVCLSARVCRNLFANSKSEITGTGTGRKLSEWWKLLMESAEGEGGRITLLYFTVESLCHLQSPRGRLWRALQSWRLFSVLLLLLLLIDTWEMMRCDALSMHTPILSLSLSVCSINKKKKKRFSKERERIAWQLAARRRKKSDGRMRRMQKLAKIKNQKEKGNCTRVHLPAAAAAAARGSVF